MKYLKIIICVFLILAGPFFDSWNDFSTEHNILTQLLRILGQVCICFICIRFLLNLKKTAYDRVVQGCIFALFGILMAYAAWIIFTTKDDIAMSSFAAILALGSIISSISSFFNWQKDSHKQYTIISNIISVLILISFLALLIFEIMSIRPVE